LPICCGCFIAGLWQLTGDKHHKGRQFESVFHDLLQNSMRLFMMSMIIQKLIPARFLLITAHVVITVCIIWSRDMNVIAGLPDKYSPDDYSRKDFEFTIALCLSFACFFVEYVGFLCGISMFIPACAFFSSTVHFVSTLILVAFIFGEWSSSVYWYIWAFCCALPAAVELVVVLKTLLLHSASWTTPCC
ncbi:Transmembrane protein, partial [Trichinella sp. T8]